VSFSSGFFLSVFLQSAFQRELLAFQARLPQGQIEEIHYAGVGTSQLYAVITGVLDI